MKQTLIAMAVMAYAGAVLATGTPPVATVTVTGSGMNSVNSSSAAGSYVLGAGTSKSTATNTQTATSYVGGAGGATSGTAYKAVSLEECAPATKVKGILTTGGVSVFGGTSATGSSTASNTSTGSGVGAAQAVGNSYAEVSGKSMLTSPSINLSAEGTSFSGVATDTGVVGTNGSGSSSGAVASSFKASAHGSLFTYNANGIAGDVKSVTTNTYTNVGGIPVVSGSGHCVTCTTGSTLVNNAIVEGGASANANGSVIANVILKP